ncbi:hypothetical protein [Pararhizobium mangrovi]|uniref:Uncharacterized protein n=1 Tax=Pararhizobium mangrovi TaxID=2590452 RepID=A0A506UEW2_9HYPH|nr:hypothetical protein [Pararhizobium mangrovi]TPW32016.1 hypothetical protein FJU11_02170 [Pararhizobium mangrovi]
MTDDTKTARKRELELEKNYGKVACKGVLGAAQMSRQLKEKHASKGFASHTPSSSREGRASLSKQKQK